MKVSSKSGSLTWFNPTVCKVSKWTLSFNEYWEVGFKLEQPWSGEVTTGPTSTELPTPKVPKVMAAINKDLLLEVFPRGLEVLSIPGGGPEVTADTLAPDPEALELGSSVTVTEVLFWLSWSVSGDEEVGSFQDDQVWSKDQSSSQEVQSQSSYHQSSKLTCPTYQLSCHEVSSFSPVFVSPKFDVSFSVQLSVHGVSVHEVSSTAFTRFKAHSREVWPGFQQVKQTTPLPFPLCEVFPNPFPLFPLKSFPFPFPLLLPPFPFMKFQWPNPFPLPLLFPLKYPLPFSAPTSMGASPESEEVKMCLLLKYCTRVFLICSYVLIVAAFNRRCCWSAPEVLFIKVATSTLSGIGVPVCCSYLAFTVSQALKSCSKVCVLNFHSSILVRSDTCRVASGSEKRWLSLRQVSKPFPAAFWRTRSLADPVHKLASR